LSDAQLGGIGYLVSGIGFKAFHVAFYNSSPLALKKMNPIPSKPVPSAQYQVPPQSILAQLGYWDRLKRRIKIKSNHEAHKV
jgi:hypothetical protein